MLIGWGGVRADDNNVGWVWAPHDVDHDNEDNTVTYIGCSAFSRVA